MDMAGDQQSIQNPVCDLHVSAAMLQVNPVSCLHDLAARKIGNAIDCQSCSTKSVVQLVARVAE